MPNNLKDLKPGECGVVMRISGEGAIRRRLIDMGITPGTRVAVRRVAPLGDPIEITLRGYELSLRRDDALKIILREEEREQACPYNCHGCASAMGKRGR